MDEVTVAYAKNSIAVGTAFFGYTMNEWLTLLSILFVIINTIAVLPKTIEVLRALFNKERREDVRLRKNARRAASKSRGVPDQEG